MRARMRNIRDNSIDILSETFEIFTMQTQKLREAHEELKRQIEEINTALEAKNRALKRKINELHETKGYLNNILEGISSGVIAVDLNGTINIFNRAAEQITHYSRKEVLGKKYRKKFAKGQPATAAIMEALQSHGTVTNQQRKMITKDGVEIIISCSTAPICDADGKVIGAIETFSDLTEVKKLEEQVRRADRLAVLGEMAATVAHEIRNPLGGIEGFALLLEKDLEHDEQLRIMARNIVDGARSLNRIVATLLDFTRPVELNLQHEKIDEIIESAFRFLNEDTSRSMEKIKVEKRYETDRPLLADKERLSQVFLNLILNAVQAMPDGGHLKIVSREVDSGVEIRMEDTGCGIPDEIGRKLFTPFFTTKEDGTGLGLPTAQKIISAHGGQIAVESKVGQGSTFTIKLPTGKGI